MKKSNLLIILFLSGFSVTQAQMKKGAPKKTKTVSKSPTVAVSEGTKFNVAAINSVDDAVKVATPVEEKTKTGTVNWTEQFIEAKGSSIIDTTHFKNIVQAKAMASRGAVVVAQRNLLEIINGVNVSGETTVQDMITTSDVISTKVQGLIKGAQLVGEPVEKNGMVEVTMRVPIYKADGLAPVVFDAIPGTGRGAQSIEMTEKPNQDAATSTMPSSTTNNDTKTAETDALKDLEKKLVFNLNGKKYDPSMFPIITDSNGKILLDMSKLYDPKNGTFPRILQTSKDVMKSAGFNKGADVIDVISAANGKITVSDIAKNKVNWAKIAKTASTIGKFILMLV